MFSTLSTKDCQAIFYLVRLTCGLRGVKNHFIPITASKGESREGRFLPYRGWMNCEVDTECNGERADGNNGAGVNKNKRVRAASRFFLHSLFYFWNRPKAAITPSCLSSPMLCIVLFRLLPCFYLFLIGRSQVTKGDLWLEWWRSGSAHNLCMW